MTFLLTLCAISIRSAKLRPRLASVAASDRVDRVDWLDVRYVTLNEFVWSIKQAKTNIKNLRNKYY
jgi:hypothetical protein